MAMSKRCTSPSGIALRRLRGNQLATGLLIAGATASAWCIALPSRNLSAVHQKLWTPTVWCLVFLVLHAQMSQLQQKFMAV